MTVYVGVGHGRRPDGRYDPGALAYEGGRVVAAEHDLAHLVADHAAAALARSGVGVFVERDAGASHDPNWSGTAKAVNAGGYEAACEIHFDWSGAPPGGFGLYGTDADRRLVDGIGRAWSHVGLPRRRDARRSDLGLLNGTSVPCCLWECAPIARHDPATLLLYGEAIAAGLCAAIGAVYAPHTTYSYQGDDMPQDLAVFWPGPRDDKGRRPFIRVTATGATYAHNGAPAFRALSSYGVNRDDIIGAELIDGRLVLATRETYQEPDGSWNAATFELEQA